MGVTTRRLQQRAGLPGLNGGGAAAAVPHERERETVLQAVAFHVTVRQWCQPKGLFAIYLKLYKKA